MNGAPTGAALPASFGQGLGSLFDLAGVYGSFLVTQAGDVAARALPQVVDDATLAEVGGRVIRLGDTFQTTGISPELCVLRFAEHKLYIKTLASGALCIVTGSNVSLPALRMAANLVARKVGADLGRVAAAAQPAAPLPARASSSGFAAVSVSTPVPPGEDGPGSAPAPTGRRYRGRPIG